MATKTTGWKCVHGASIVSETDTTATIRVTCYWQNAGWTYAVNYVSAWVYCNGESYKVKNSGYIDTTSSTTAKVSMGYYDFVIDKTTAAKSIACYGKITCNSSYVSGTKTSSSSNVTVSAKPSYTVTYNANGGTGAPANQTKWYGTNLTLASGTPARTGYTFVRWNTNTNNTGTGYAPGATYTGNAALTLYAIWTPNTYTVTYNANGGTGAPANQTKTYGVNLTLSSTKPTLTNYNFLGWATSENGGVVYNAGSTYINNSAITLYAVWELAYIKPRINNFNAQRCNSSGTASETGTYVKITFDWATDLSVSSILIEWKTQPSHTWTNEVSVTCSGTNGSVSQIVGNGEIGSETSYTFRSSVTDSGGTTLSPEVPIATIKFPIDVKRGGTGVAFGKVAEEDHVFDVNLYSKFRDEVEVLKEIRKNHGYYQAFRGYTNDADTALTHGYYNTNDGTTGLPSVANKYGILEVIESRCTSWDYSDGSSWIWQIYRDTNGNEYHRNGSNNETMSSWKKVVFETV